MIFSYDSAGLQTDAGLSYDILPGYHSQDSLQSTLQTIEAMETRAAGKQQQYQTSADASVEAAFATMPTSDGTLPAVIHDAIYASLKSLVWIDCMHSDRRKDAMTRQQADSHGGRGVRSFGLSRCPNRNVNKEASHPDPNRSAFRQLRALFSRVMEKQHPAHTWDTVHINHSWQCGRHRDTSNSGTSIICGFGDYAGGELLVEPEGVSDPQLAVRHDIRAKIVPFNGVVSG